MRNFGRLQSNKGTFCNVGFDFNATYEELLQRGDIDFLILATENGFSPFKTKQKEISSDTEQNKKVKKSKNTEGR